MADPIISILPAVISFAEIAAAGIGFFVLVFLFGCVVRRIDARLAMRVVKPLEQADRERIETKVAFTFAALYLPFAVGVGILVCWSMMSVLRDILGFLLFKIVLPLDHFLRTASQWELAFLTRYWPWLLLVVPAGWAVFIFGYFCKNRTATATGCRRGASGPGSL
jgi:hypothetical protein